MVILINTKTQTMRTEIKIELTNEFTEKKEIFNAATDLEKYENETGQSYIDFLVEFYRPMFPNSQIYISWKNGIHNNFLTDISLNEMNDEIKVDAGDMDANDFIQKWYMKKV